MRKAKHEEFISSWGTRTTLSTYTRPALLLVRHVRPAGVSATPFLYLLLVSLSGFVNLCTFIKTQLGTRADRDEPQGRTLRLIILNIKRKSSCGPGSKGNPVDIRHCAVDVKSSLQKQMLNSSMVSGLTLSYNIFKLRKSCFKYRERWSSGNV